MSIFACKRLWNFWREQAVSDPLPPEMQNHLEDCASCRSLYAEHDRLHRHLGAMAQQRSSLLSIQDTPVPPLEQMRAKITSPKVKPQHRAIPARVGWAGGAFAVAIVLGILLVSLHRHGPPPEGVKVTFYRDGLNPIAGGPSAHQPPSRARVVPPKLYSDSNGPLKSESARTFSSGLSSKSEGLSPHVAAKKRGLRLVAPRPAADIPPEVGTSKRPDDLAYVNAPVARTPGSGPTSVKKARPVGDDFVAVPLPQLAAAESRATDQVVGDAVRRYEQEKSVVDDRLAQKIDLELPVGDLRSLADALHQKSGVLFEVQKDLEDLKLTVLIKQVPVRDLMRQVVRLFNLEWRRRGEEGHYTYLLTQTLKQRLAEEQSKRGDQDQMVLNIDKELNRYLPYLDLPADRLSAMKQDAEERAKSAGSTEARFRATLDVRMFDSLADPKGNGAVRLYSRLSGDQIVQLRETGEVTVPAETVAGALTGPLLGDLQKGQAQAFASFGDVLEKGPDGQTRLEVHMKLDHSQPERAALSVEWRSYLRDGADVSAMAPHSSMSDGRSLTVGVPDRLLDPNNAAAHLPEKNEAAFARRESLDPQPQSPLKLASESPTASELERVWHMGQSFAGAEEPVPEAGGAPGNPKEWVDSADVFTEIHRKTGRNLISDYYLRVYPRAAFRFDNARLVDLLNDVADGLKSSWSADGTFLRFRRFDYYTQRAQDIPNRQLALWKAQRDRQGFMRLDDMSEIAALPDRLQKDLRLEQAVMLKWGLLEWPTAISLGTKPLLKIYGALNPIQRQAVQSDAGLSFAELTPEQVTVVRQAPLYFKGGIDAGNPGYHRLYMRVRGPGSYSWEPPTHESTTLVFPGKEVVYETGAEKAKAAMTKALESRPDVRAGIEKSLPSIKQWRPWATGDTELEGQMKGPGTLIWTSIQSGNEFMTFYSG